MSSQKLGKTKQKSLLSWVKPQDTKARVEDENVEESCAAEISEGSSESGQEYAAVESVKDPLSLTMMHHDLFIMKYKAVTHYPL